MGKRTKRFEDIKDKRFKGKTIEEYLEFRERLNKNNRKYYNKPEVKEKKRLYKKEYDKKNKEKIREYGKELRSRPEYQKRVKKWRKENREHLREYASKPENRKRKSISNKKWIEKNKEKIKKKRSDPEFRRKKKLIYERNKEHLKRLRKRYYKTERGKLSVQNCNHRRLALKKGKETDLTTKKINNIFKRDKVCVYCGSDKNFELDHIIPLTNQGSCMSNNIVLSCAKCNRSKSGRNVFYWCKLQGIQVPRIVISLLKDQGIKL